jgi:hypothetical protein
MNSKRTMCIAMFAVFIAAASLGAQEPKSAAAAIAAMQKAMRVGVDAAPLSNAIVITDSVRLSGSEFTCASYKEVTRCRITDGKPRVIFRVVAPDRDLHRVHPEIDSMWIEMVTLTNHMTRDSMLVVNKSVVQYMFNYVNGRWIKGRRGLSSVD